MDDQRTFVFICLMVPLSSRNMDIFILNFAE